MKGLFVIGLSHKTAPLDVRERFAVSAAEVPALLSELEAAARLRGVFAVSTCNRFEVYASSADESAATERVRTWFVERAREQNLPEVGAYLYAHTGPPALHHLLRVASSLDSLVVGEAQILGQVKEAYGWARRVGTIDRVLERCMARALRVARTVRRETEIARHPVSIPQVSLELAGKVFGDLTGRTVLLVGAGKMSEMAARSLKSHGVTRTLVANRDPERARELARKLDAEAYGLEALEDLLVEADIVLTSTASKRFVIDPELVKRALKRRRHRPVFIIDIALPRDVDPRVGQLSNVYLFDLDDLQAVVESNLGARQREAREGERIVVEQAAQFAAELQQDRVAPTIVALRRKLTAIRDEETELALARLNGLDDNDRTQIVRLTHSLVNRILHEPMVALKQMAGRGSSDEAIDVVHALFGLDPDDPGDATEESE